ncbi:MAG: hypothetical protein PHH77_03300 [Victivallaceae bacterium]|nr:hypothetical protein [Victivallaceae bacterium]
MRPGDKIVCPACRNQTVVKEKTELDGWTVREKLLVCAFCGAKLGSAVDVESDEHRNRKAVSGLAALFEAELETGPVITEEAGDRQFCKYCDHYVAHAFVERCQLHQRETAALERCPDFKQKEGKADDGEKPVSP